MINTIQEGGTLNLIAPTGGVVSGQGFLIGSFFAVAGNGPDARGPIVAGQNFPGVLVNVVRLTKKAAEVWVQGDDIHWDDSAKEASNVSGDRKIGAASVGAAGPDPTGDVRLDGISAAEPASASIFVSAQVAATGAPQPIAHGLGVIPSEVTVQLESGHNGAGAVGDLVPLVNSDGAHDVTNAEVTVTIGALFKVTAYV